MTAALSIAWAATVSAARSADFPLPEPDLHISRCVVTTVEVDALVVVKHGWCRYEDGVWVPMDDLPRRRIIGIEPIKED